MAKVTDKFPQFMYMSITQSAANTLTFGQVSLGMGLFDYAGLIIQRIEYRLAKAGFQELVANADEIDIAVTGSNTITAIGTEQPEVYDRIELYANLVGAAANVNNIKMPIVHDFTGYDAGGILVPAQDIFIAADSSGCVAAVYAQVRLWYKVIKLTAADFIELVQRLRVLST